VLFNYFRKHDPITPAPPTRITRMN
jgi:hypothetical protein